MRRYEVVNKQQNHAAVVFCSLKVEQFHREVRLTVYTTWQLGTKPPYHGIGLIGIDESIFHLSKLAGVCNRLDALVKTLPSTLIWPCAGRLQLPFVLRPTEWSA